MRSSASSTGSVIGSLGGARRDRMRCETRDHQGCLRGKVQPLPVDARGFERAQFGGGLNATLRELARFGELKRREGHLRLLPVAEVADNCRRSDPVRFATVGYARCPATRCA
jgi:hypothetical protein